jgi:hypothetical protein
VVAELGSGRHLLNLTPTIHLFGALFFADRQLDQWGYEAIVEAPTAYFSNAGAIDGGIVGGWGSYGGVPT